MTEKTLKFKEVLRFGERYFYPLNIQAEAAVKLAGAKSSLKSHHLDAVVLMGVKICVTQKELS